MFRRIVFYCVLIFWATNLFSQNDDRKNYLPIWTFHQDSIIIHGISLGLWSDTEQPRNTTTNGLKFELFGDGLRFWFDFKKLEFSSDEYNNLLNEPLSETINGVNLSLLGAGGHSLTNGLLVGTILNNVFKVNGVSAAFILNLCQKHNGLMLSYVINGAYHINGVQLALTNLSEITNGIQLAFIGNDSKKIDGLQISPFNTTVFVKGAQIGFINNSLETTKGVQIGFVNNSPEIKGVQIGIINSSYRVNGIQIGLVNFSEYRILPIVNWNF